MRILKKVKYNLSHIPGWKTKRKIVVIESDDWGSIRMPSKEIFLKLQKDGYQPEKDPYLKYDSLASEDDLNALFDVLTSVKDINGNNAKITANCVVANPDFKKIADSNFQDYFYESFTETLKNYDEHGNSFKLWKEGINNNIFHPQFHGREHMNVYNWLKGLQNGDKNLHKAFENKMISISSLPSKMRFGYMESLDYFSDIEKESKSLILEDGLKLFNDIFNFSSQSFIANCYIWDNKVEEVLAKNNVKYIQGIPFQFIPNLNNKEHKLSRKYHFTGQSNKFNQNYIVRNMHFEPSQYSRVEITDILKRIEIAFKWNKPAIISSHRLNFIGYIDSKNRENNLKKFKELLTMIVSKWPDIEFMTSDELGNLM